MVELGECLAPSLLHDPQIFVVSLDTLAEAHPCGMRLTGEVIIVSLTILVRQLEGLDLAFVSGAVGVRWPKKVSKRRGQRSRQPIVILPITTNYGLGNRDFLPIHKSK
jgi:hypothetical protein